MVTPSPAGDEVLHHDVVVAHVPDAGARSRQPGRGRPGARGSGRSRRSTPRRRAGEPHVAAAGDRPLRRYTRRDGLGAERHARQIGRGRRRCLVPEDQAEVCLAVGHRGRASAGSASSADVDRRMVVGATRSARGPASPTRTGRRPVGPGHPAAGRARPSPRRPYAAPRRPRPRGPAAAVPASVSDTPPSAAEQ